MLSTSNVFQKNKTFKSREAKTDKLIVCILQAICHLTSLTPQRYNDYKFQYFYKYDLMLRPDGNIWQLGLTLSFANRKHIKPDTEHPPKGC